MYKLDLEEIQAEILQAGHGQKSAVVNRYVEKFGFSRCTIYRQLSSAYGKKKILRREKQVDQDLIDMIADIKLRGIEMGLGERELATELCIDMLVDQGVTGAESLTVSTVNRRLVEAGFRIRTPKVRVEADYANQEHQIDFSRSKYFQLHKYDAEREDYILRVSGRELHYKKDDKRMRTWIVQIKDSYSRCRLAKAYGAASEDGFIGLDLLDFLWMRGDDEHCMRHVMDMLKSDNGSFSRRTEVKAVFKSLGVQLRHSAPYNHDSQGKIESGFASIWRRFELPLAIKLGDRAEIYLHEYNELLHDFMIRDSQRMHTFKKDTRESVYRMSILKHPPKVVDVDILKIACRIDERVVTETLEVRFEGERYEAPPYCSEKRIRIYKNLNGELMGELPDNSRKPFLLEPYTVRSIDDFDNRPHQTYRQERERIVHAQDKKEKSTEKSSGRLFMPAKEKKVKVESVFNETDETEFKSKYDAQVYIGQRLRVYGDSYADYDDVFDELLDVDLSYESVEAVLDGIRQQKTMRLAL